MILEKGALFSIPIAHRGVTSENKKILPNTLEACMLTINKNIPLEIDVRITSNSELILMHGIYILLENSELKYYKELNDFDIANKYINKSQCKIPRLEQVLKKVNGKIPILLDIKFENYGDKKLIEKKIKNILSTYSGDIFIQSFWPCVRKIGKIKKGIILPSVSWMTNFILKTFNYDFISFNCDSLNMGMAIKLKKIGKPILLWNYDVSKHSFYKKYLNANIIIDIVEEKFYLPKQN